MCTFVHPKTTHEEVHDLHKRLRVLEHDRAAYETRMDDLMRHGDHMLDMMDEFKSILQSASPKPRRYQHRHPHPPQRTNSLDSMDGTGPCRLPQTS